MNLIDQRDGCLPLSVACGGIAFSKATYYRVKKNNKNLSKRRVSPRALSSVERQNVLDVLHEPRFMDLSVGQVYAHLLDEGRYIASERTMYRILASENEVRERRRIRRHGNYKKPELLARGPNQLWSWDITRMRGPTKLEYYHLYVILDVYSRYVVGWMLATVESAELAKQLLRETCEVQGIKPNSLTIHSDRGPAMKSKTVAELLTHLGVVKSHSRPRISNDNPYSESQFKTMKYSSTYPDRFGSFEDAQAFCRDFFAWYNHEHYHSGIKMLTPASVHDGKADEILRDRNKVKFEAFKRHKERFVGGKPELRGLEKEVWINRPKDPPVGHLFSKDRETVILKACKGFSQKKSEVLVTHSSPSSLKAEQRCAQERSRAPQGGAHSARTLEGSEDTAISHQDERCHMKILNLQEVRRKRADQWDGADKKFNF